MTRLAARFTAAATWVAVAGVVLVACGRVQPDPAAAIARQAAASTLPTISPPSTTVPSSTTIDPGELPQTAALPTTSGPGFSVRLQTLWQAVVDGNPDEALPFFFPRSAYLQVKAISDPGADWQSRLVADYDQDIMTLHRALGSSAAGATLAGIDVPPGAVWVRPGAEFNRLSYWRVYRSRVRYVVAGVTRSFTIASMISWRGEWYVVHLSSIR